MSGLQSLIEKLATWLLGRREVGLRNSPAGDDDEPLCAAHFCRDQMVAHGKRLAAEHVVYPNPGPDRLLARLKSNERVLASLDRELSEATAEGAPAPLAAEGLLDKLYLNEEKIRTA